MLHNSFYQLVWSSTTLLMVPAWRVVVCESKRELEQVYLHSYACMHALRGMCVKIALCVKISGSVW